MKTQKFLMALAAIAALSMSSCTQEEELLVSNNNSFDDPNAVLFGTYASQAPQSRGAEMNIAAIQTSGFGVYAYYTGTVDFAIDGTNAVEPNFMCNQQVKWDATAKYPANDDESVAPGMWSYSPVKYWPNNLDEKVSFFAYAPYTKKAVGEKEVGITSLPTNATTGDPKIGYTLSSNPGEQLDLLYSGDMLNLVKQDVKQKVTFKFNHAMSRIGFKRVIEVDEVNKNQTPEYDSDNPQYTLANGSTVTITKVTLSSTSFYKSGTLNLRTGKWDEFDTEAQAYTLTENDFTAARNATAGDSNEPLQLNADDKYLMIFPTGESNKIPIDITVEFNVTTTDKSLKNEKSQITSQVTTSFYFDFVQGKSYNFVLHIGLTSVKLDAESTAWNDTWNENDDQSTKSEVVVNMPGNNTVSLIYDANGGKFLNGSKKYIVTAPVGNWKEGEEGTNGYSSSEYARFILQDFQAGENGDIMWIKEGSGDNTTEYELCGWTDKRDTNHSTLEKLEELGITICPEDKPIFVKKDGNTASKTIYAWWPGEAHIG